jgi:hypothetical protein
MANEPSMLARSQPRTAPASDDYQAFSEVLGASARGRAFLDEHARRSRQADSAALLAALSRIEAMMRANAGTAAEPLRAELRKLVADIRRARPELAASSLPARAAQLAVLLDVLERRLTDLAAPAAVTGAEPGRIHLAVVPPAEEPELPIPSPAPAQPPIALAAAPKTPPATVHAIPQVTVFEAPSPAVAEPAVSPSAPTAQPPAPAAPVDEAGPWRLSAAKLAPPPSDPLAAIMLLSEDERIALFT